MATVSGAEPNDGGCCCCCCCSCCACSCSNSCGACQLLCLLLLRQQHLLDHGDRPSGAEVVAGNGERAKANGFEREPEGNADDIVFDA